MPPLDQAFAKAYGTDLASYGVAVPPVAPHVSTAPSLEPARDVRSVTNRAAILPLSAVTEAAPPAHEFRALLQIERCLWPEIVRRLADGKSEPLTGLEAELRQMLNQRHLIVGIASTSAGAGSTTLAQVLARRFGHGDTPLAVVDAHFARPALAASWQILPQVGWEHMLRGELALDEVLIESAADRLTLLPLKSAPADVDSLLAGSRLELSLRILRQNFPLTLIDLGPLGLPLIPAVESILSTELIEAVVLVDSARHPQGEALVELQAALTGRGVRWTAVVENFAV